MSMTDRMGDDPCPSLISTHQQSHNLMTSFNKVVWKFKYYSGRSDIWNSKFFRIIFEIVTNFGFYGLDFRELLQSTNHLQV